MDKVEHFERQLARYGFTKITLGQSWTEYSHPNFIKNKPEQLHLIRKPDREDKSTVKASVKQSKVSRKSKSVKNELEEIKNQFTLLVDYNKNMLDSNRDLLNQLHEYRQAFKAVTKKTVFVLATLSTAEDGLLMKNLSDYFKESGIKTESNENNQNKAAELSRIINEKILFSGELDCQVADDILNITYKYLEQKGQVEVDFAQFRSNFEQKIAVVNEGDNEEKPFVIEKNKSMSINNAGDGDSEVELRDRAMSVQSINSKFTDQNLVDFAEMGSVSFGDSLLNTPLRPIQPAASHFSSIAPTRLPSSSTAPKSPTAITTFPITVRTIRNWHNWTPLIVRTSDSWANSSKK